MGRQKRKKRLASYIRGLYRIEFRKEGFLSCGICQKKILDEEEISVDHKIPLKWGGADHGDNMQPSHRKCNRVKGSNVSEEDAPVYLELEFFLRYDRLRWGEWKG